MKGSFNTPLIYCLTVVLLAGLMSATASAGVYRWVDRNGNVHFSDDPVKAGKARAYEPDEPKVYPATVMGIGEKGMLELNTGKTVELAGIDLMGQTPAKVDEPQDRPQTPVDYLKENLKNRAVFIWEEFPPTEESPARVYVFLGRQRFINAEMIQQGLARSDSSSEHRYQKLFDRLQRRAKKKREGFWKYDVPSNR